METVSCKCRVIIFDVDDLLFRSEETCARAMIAACAEHGIPLTLEEYVDFWVIQKKGTADYVAEKGLSIDPSILRTRYAEELERMAPTIEWMPGGEDIIRRYYGTKTLAVGSGNSRKTVEAFLKAHQVFDLFSTIVTVDDITNRKPDPETFLKVAVELGVDPSECIVLEDTVSGVLAAKNAGMRAIAVPGPDSLEHDFSTADLVYDSLLEISTEDIDALFTT